MHIYIYIYIKLIQLNKRNPNNTKIGRGYEQTFSQRRYKMSNKHMKRCLSTLIITECKPKPP